MYDIDYNYTITENDGHGEDVVLIINDCYSNSDICEVCAPTGGTIVPHYDVVKNMKEEPPVDVFYNLDYAL